MTTTTLEKQLLTPREVAEYLNVKLDTLATWRSAGRNVYGLKFVKIGKKIMYRRRDIDAFIDRRTTK